MKSLLVSKDMFSTWATHRLQIKSYGSDYYRTHIIPLITALMLAVVAPVQIALSLACIGTILPLYLFGRSLFHDLAHSVVLAVIVPFMLIGALFGCNLLNYLIDKTKNLYCIPPLCVSHFS